MSSILWGPCKVAARGASLEKNKEMAMVLCKYLNKGEPLTDVLQIKDRMVANFLREHSTS